MSTPRLTELIETSGGNYPLRVAKGLVHNAEPFMQIGYNPAITTTEEDLWATGGSYVFPTAAAQWRIAGGNAGDLGTVIKGNAEGSNQTVKCDATGSATILNDANVDFSAATAVAVGDIVLLDPKGTSPEFGYVTDITDAATGTLVIGGGFSDGGSCATARAYTIVDKSGAAGAQVVEVYYLTSAYVEKEILVALNGATAVDFKGSGGAALTDCYRLNGLRVVSVGSGGVPVAAIVLQLQAGPNTVYGSISAGYNHSRDGFYTVPYGKTLFIDNINFSAAAANVANPQTARVILRSDSEHYSGFKTGGIFYPIAETMITDATQDLMLSAPIKVMTGVDIKASAIGLTGFTGPASCVIRGWLE